MNYYQAFGLTWSLPFLAPELHQLGNRPELIDVEVCTEKLPELLAESKPAGPLMRVRPEAAHVDIPGLARFAVEHGKRITIDAAGPIDHQCRLFLYGTVSSLLLLQRNLLPLHGSGVLTPKGVVLFVGHSGFGKSTLLAAFLERGYEMVTDDIAALDVRTEGVKVLPSFPQMKLWENSLTRLGRSSEGLPYARTPEIDKFSVSISGDFSPESAPLYAIYALKPRNQSEIEIKSLDHSRKINILIDHTWQKLALKRQNRHLTHFQQIAKVANQARIKRVYRPEAGFKLDQLADLIEEDFSA